MKITNIGAGDGLEPLPWEAVQQRLNAGEPPAVAAPNQRTTWLTTVNADGSPHVTAVGALWLDGAFWFQTGAATGKARNVARDPRCAISTSILEMDVVVEGSAERVTDTATVARLATRGPTRAGLSSPMLKASASSAIQCTRTWARALAALSGDAAFLDRRSRRRTRWLDALRLLAR